MLPHQHQTTNALRLGSRETGPPDNVDDRDLVPLAQHARQLMGVPMIARQSESPSSRSSLTVNDSGGTLVMMVRRGSPGRFVRSPQSGRLWIPEGSPALLPLQASENLQTFVPHDAVFPGLANDFPEFKRLLRSLSRTDTIFWCARLNILVSDSELDTLEVQSKCLRVFLREDEINRINVFAYQRGGASKVQAFFRGQLLELLRWATLFCSDLPDDGVTFNDEDVRRRFVRAALLASDIWGRRIYEDRLSEDLTVGELRKSVLPAIRRMSLENAPCPDPLLQIARGASLFADRMRARADDMESSFQKAVGLGVDDYFSMLARLAADGLFVVRTAEGYDSLQDPKKCGLFDANAYESAPEPMGSIAKAFLGRESQTAEELRKAFWGQLTDADDERAGKFDLKVLRERPIFRAANGLAIILEPRFFVERGSAGPLFQLVKARRNEQLRWFALFGDIFEGYAQEILALMYPDKEGLSRRFFAKPKGQDDRSQAVDLGDGFLLGIDTLAILEMKAAWTPDAAVSPAVTATAYMEEIRARYGITENPREGDRSIKGLGQLARTIRNVADGVWTVSEPSLAGFKTVLPVLLVHDAHIGAPLHSHILAREFASYLGVAQPERDGWPRMQRGTFTIAHLIVLTLDDLEILEPSSRRFSLLECLESYDRACPDRMISFHDFLAVSPYRRELRANDRLASRCLELLEQCQARLFPDSPGLASP